MKRRLIVGSVIAVMTALWITVLLAVPLLQNYYQSEMRRRLDLVLVFLTDDEQAIRQDPQGTANDLARRFADMEQPLRLTFLDAQGFVIGDSHSESSSGKQVDNHLDRPEIKEALSGEETGYDIRTSATTDIPSLYAATRLSGGIFVRVAMPLDQMESTSDMLWLSALTGIVAGLGVAIAAASILNRRMMKPIEELTTASRRIALGDYDIRVGEHKDEMGALADTFNIMAVTLQKAVSDLESSQVQLETVIHGMDDGVVAATKEGVVLFANEKADELIGTAEMKKGIVLSDNTTAGQLAGLMKETSATGKIFHETLRILGEEEKILSVYVAPLEGGNMTGSALAVLRDTTKIVRLEQLRSDFVANVTHELKTPLTSIRGFIELLRGSSRDQETRHYFYDVIDIEAERLNNLIDDLLALSEIESKRGEAEWQQCNVAEELRQTVERCAPLAEKNGITVSMDADAGLSVYASSGRIQQMFENILVNAIKYNHPDGRVDIRALKQNGKVEIRFRDTGVGIAEEDIQRIFERFYRVDKSRSREVGGTGLGLSIVKHLVNLYDGEVDVKSTPGEGTEFILRF